MPKPGNEGIRDLWESAVSNLTDPIDPAFVRKFQESTLAQAVPPSFLGSVVRESFKVPARVWKAALKPLLDADFFAEVGSVTSPTLILWGNRDELTTRIEQDVLNASIPGSDLVVYGGAGHALHWEEPARFACESEQLRPDPAEPLRKTSPVRAHHGDARALGCLRAP